MRWPCPSGAPCGSADLTGSNLTNWSGSTSLNTGDFHARHISYGVREFGMSAILNGIALYGGFIPYGATFLTFSDYSRNALRMSALMNLRAITSSRTIPSGSVKRSDTSVG